MITAHAEMAAISGGTPSGTRSTLVSETTTRSAKQETPIRWWMRSPPRCRRVVPSISPLVDASTRPKRQSTGLPATHASHSPQRGRQSRATRSPTDTRSRDPRTDGLDDAGPLVADHEGSFAGRSPVM